MFEKMPQMSQSFIILNTPQFFCGVRRRNLTGSMYDD